MRYKDAPDFDRLIDGPSHQFVFRTSPHGAPNGVRVRIVCLVVRAVLHNTANPPHGQRITRYRSGTPDESKHASHTRQHGAKLRGAVAQKHTDTAQARSLPLCSLL